MHQASRLRAALATFDREGRFGEPEYALLRAVLAASLGRHGAASDLLDGLANLFFERHVMNDRRRAELLGMDDESLLRAVRTRFRQVVAGENDEHAPYHALRAHVREALDAMGTPRGEWPATVRGRSGFSRALVEQAVGAYFAELRRRPSVAEATAELFSRYVRRLSSADEVTETHHVPEALSRRLDGQRLAAGILEVLEADEKDLLRWVLCGEGSVEKWAEKAAVSRATAYRLMARLKALCKLEFQQRSDGTQLAALKALREELKE